MSVQEYSLNRRKLLKGALATSVAMSFSAKSYSNIMGANDRMNMAVIGTVGRGQALIKSIAASTNTRISYVCDVDNRALNPASLLVEQLTKHKSKTEKDFRRLLDDKDIDGFAIATPDHWHAPMALMGVDAGKHVYLEKPCSHNPHEGELLVQAQQKHKRVIQMGNQQRSAPSSMQAMVDIKAGLIGEVYYAKAWYTNRRESIGKGKKTAAPDWLDWELWQGPAPRSDFQDNLVHYNWHWFWNWGTGEINNNGAHEIDIARWALGVDYPQKVTSSGGRYHFQDDWQFYDTQTVGYEFPGNKLISWEGRSCNGMHQHDRDRGTIIHGTKGTIILDRNKYQAFNHERALIKEVKEKSASATTNTVGEGALDVYHMQNFLDAVRLNKKQNSPIDEGHKSVLLCHLGNIAQVHGGALEIDPKNGHILNNPKANAMWTREYAKGWEPKV